MNELQIFNNPDFGTIRTILINNDPWFVGKDVASALGYVETAKAVRERVNDEDRGVSILDTPGGKQRVIVVNESGVYALIFGSKLPKAKDFKHWVTSEVLPAIRKHGGYLTSQKIDEILSDPDTIIKLATDLKNERLKRIEAERNAKENHKLAEESQKQLEEQAPKVAFAEAITSSSNSCLIGELAKLIKQACERKGIKINIGQNRFFQWLRDNNYLGKSRGYRNIANQEYIEQGLFELKKSTHDENGILVTTTTTKITGHGQSYFINGFLSGKFKIE